MKKRAVSHLALACLGTVVSSVAWATPTVQTLSDSHGSYYLVNNGPLSGFQIYSTGSLAGKITGITYDGQQMIGTKDIYYDIQGSPNIYLGSAETYSVRTGANFVDISAFHAATVAEPLDVTWHWILQDGAAGFSTYLTYHHTTAMADYASSENRLGAEFFNDALFNYSSITDNFWGYQAAGDANRNQGRFITAETSDMRGVPSEYIKNYETKYDWRSTYQQSNGVTGIFTAANTNTATRPLVANDYGIWSINNYRTYESWNAGPTHPQTPVADGASLIPSPPGSHFGGPDLVYTGNMDKAFGPIFTYFNKATDINALRSDASQYANGASAVTLNTFYDSLNLPYYATAAQRGTVSGKVRQFDGSNMDGATVVLSAFDPAGYAVDPLGQEYQRRAAGYNYWVSPNKDGTFSLPDVRPGTYRVTVIKPGVYREATWDNITVTAGNTTSVGNLTFAPDINGNGVWQIGKFDRTAGEFRDGQNYNNWIDTFNAAKEFPNGVNYTVNPSNSMNDTQNWATNWGLNQINGSLDFWNVNFNLASAPAANSTVTLTMAIADSQYINDIGALVYNASGTSYNRVDATFDHTEDYAPSTFRSGDTSSRVLYRKLTIPASWLHSGSNKISFHIVGGNMQWDALRLDIQNPGTFSIAQWNGGTGNWSDAAQWSTQQYGYTSVNKGAVSFSGVANPNYPNDSSTSFFDGAAAIAPVNNTGSSLYYDAAINGGTITLDISAAVQKLSLLEGMINVNSGKPVLTANDAVVLGGGTLNGTGTLNALTTTAVNFTNTISGGFVVNSSGAVTVTDGATVIVTGAGSKWNTIGLTYGQTLSTYLSIASGGLVSSGSGALVIGAAGSLAFDGGTFSGATITNSGTITGSGTFALTGSFNNSGVANVSGGLSGTAVVNSGGALYLNGTNAYTGVTTITGGLIQFGELASIGGAGAGVMVNPGGGVAFTLGVTTAGFLARINTGSTGALALTLADAATNLDFTAGPLAALSNMAVGAATNVNYSGILTPAGNTFRLGGGGGTLNFMPTIGGTSNVIIGNTGSSGTVILSGLNNFTGTTTLKGSILAAGSLANGGAASPLGSSSNSASNLVFDGGVLQYTGSAAGPTDRLFTLTGNGGTLDGSGSGTGALILLSSGSVVLSGIGSHLLTLTGTNATNVFTPALADGGTTAMSLMKAGAGTWTLAGLSKTYSGATNIQAGTLKLGSTNAIPSGAGKGDVTIDGTLNLSGFDQALNGLFGSGSVTNLSGTHNLSLGNNNTAGSFNGIISGSINVIKTGSAVLVIDSNNTYTGTTTVSAGTLQVGIGGTPGSFGPGDGNLMGHLGPGNIINNATLVFNRGYYTTVANTISGTGTVKQIANAELVLTATNTYTGPTIIGGGIANIGLGGPSDGTGLAFSGDSSLNVSILANGGVASTIGASSNLASNLILDGGTLFYSPTSAANTDRLFTVTQNGGAIYVSGPVNFSNATGSVVLSGSGDRTLSLGGDSATSSTFNGDIGDPSSGKTYLTKDRSATWTLTSNAALTYSGDTTILMGTLKLGTGEALPFGAGKGNLVFGTSTDFGSDFFPTLDLGGNDVNINGLTGGLSGGTYSRVTNTSGVHTLIVGNNNVSTTYDGVILAGVNLKKIGSGTQRLTTATNSYTGSTTVTSGTLQISFLANGGAVSGIGSSTNAAANLVFDGGTLQYLGSGATTDRLFTITPNGGAISNSGTGTMAFTSSGATVLSSTGNRTITFTGTSSGISTFAPQINNPSSGTTALVKAGNGTWSLTGSNTYTGGTTINSGTLAVNSANSLGGITGGLTLNNGTLQFNTSFSEGRPITLGTGLPTINVAASQTATLTTALAGAGTLTKTGTGKLIVPSLPTAGVSVTGGILKVNPGVPDQATRLASLTISASQLDLTNNDLLITTGSLASLQNYLMTAYANGLWNGNGLLTSNALAIPIVAMGILSGTDFTTLHPGSQFDGQNVNVSDVLIKYTYQGDADFDGKITMNDYAQINAGFFFHPTGATWVGGDFDYNGVVDYRDFALIDSAFQSQSGTLANGIISQHEAAFGQPYITALENLSQPVPEPASLPLIVLGGTALLKRRSRDGTATLLPRG